MTLLTFFAEYKDFCHYKYMVFKSLLIGMVLKTTKVHCIKLLLTNIRGTLHKIIAKKSNLKNPHLFANVASKENFLNYFINMEIRFQCLFSN